MRKKLVVSSIMALAIVGGIFRMNAVSGQHTKEMETAVQQTTIAETTQQITTEVVSAVDKNNEKTVKVSEKHNLIFPEKYKNISVIKINNSKDDAKVSDEESDEMVEVFQKKSTDSDVVGVGVDGSFITVIKKDGEWTKIKSGKITGYIKSKNIVTGAKAKKVLLETKNVVVKVSDKKVDIKDTENKKGKTVSTVYKGSEYPILDISKNKKWIKIERTESLSGWIPAKKVKVKVCRENLYTPDEYDDMLEQEWAAKAITYTLEQTKLPKDGEAAEFLEYATQFLGNRYVWGGTSLKTGADCSGFVMSLFKKFGYNLNRTAAEQANNGVAVKNNKLKPGDLVFYHTDKKNKNYISHVAIYIGDGKILHSANKTQGVIISGIGNPCAARRILTGKSYKTKNKKQEKMAKIKIATKKVKNNTKNPAEKATQAKSEDINVVDETTKIEETTEVRTTKEQTTTKPLPTNPVETTVEIAD